MTWNWNVSGRPLGRGSCYAVCGLSLAYVPALAAGLIANGDLASPVRDPYLAIMELLILPLAVALVIAFAAVHAAAPAPMKAFSLSALLLVGIMAGITVCVHLVVLTVGRHADASTLPGFQLLFSWTWPSVVYALDIAAWDFFLGMALILAAPLFRGGAPFARVRRGLWLSGTLCLAGLSGVVTGNMNLRNIGIVGYALVLPVVMLWIGRLFATAPASTGAAPQDPQLVAG